MKKNEDTNKKKGILTMRLEEEGKKPKKILSCILSSPHEKCPCGGSGFVFKKQGALGVGSVCPYCVLKCPSCLGRAQSVDENGKAQDCRKPSPKSVADALTQAQIPGRYVNASFEAFSNKTSENKEAFETIQKWAENYIPGKQGQKGFILSGGVGVGKTYLLISVIKSLALRGIRCQFIDFFQLINLIKGAYSDQKSDQDIISPLIDVEVLMIDELGKGRQTEFEQVILDQLIMGRYNQDKIIVASTNYIFDKKALTEDTSSKIYTQSQSEGKNFSHIDNTLLSDRVGSRIYSRLKETSHFLTFPGRDFRERT